MAAATASTVGSSPGVSGATGGSAGVAPTLPGAGTATTAPGPTPSSVAVGAPTDTRPEPALPAQIVVRRDAAGPMVLQITADAGSQVFGAEARLCKADAVVQFDADFRPTLTGQCIADPLSPDTDAHVEAAFAEPYASGELVFRPGAGVSRYATQDGRNVEITCGPGHPCAVVVKVQVPGGFGFKIFPVDA